jgi:hypothetical protein
MKLTRALSRNRPLDGLEFRKASKGLMSVAFVGAHHLFELGSELKEIGPSAFNMSAISAISVPSNVEKILSECFHKCASLSEVLFDSDSTLNEIDTQTFEESAIKSIRIPKSVTKMGIRCLSRCISLSEVIFQPGSKLKELDRLVLSKSGFPTRELS